MNNNILHNFHGKNIKIGIVDTGINNSIVPNIINSFKGDYPDYNDYVGHGTKVASIINSLTHSTILYNIKIFDKESNSTAQKVLEGIEYGIENKLDVINLSLGTKDMTRYKDFFYLCEEAKKKNIFIVSAISNNYSFSLPAILENVIGVGCTNNHIEDKYGYYFLEHKHIQCMADGGRYSILSDQKVLGTKNFTSFAAPIISSIIAILLEYNRSMNFEEMLSSLKCYSLPDTKTFHYIKESLFTCDLLSAMNTNWLENKIFQNSKEVLYFPVLEESIFFNEYKDLLVTKVNYDFHDDESSSNNSIKNEFDNPSFFINEDLLIINRNILLFSDSRQFLLKQICKKFVNNGKNVFSYISKDELMNIFNDPEIVEHKNIVCFNNYIDLFSKGVFQTQTCSDIPTLCIINLCNNNIDYFKIQLQLRRCFLHKDIVLSQVSSKPYSELFGFNFTLSSEIFSDNFPFSNVNSFIKYLHNELSSIPNLDLLIYSFDNSLLSPANVIDEYQTSNSILFTTSCLNNIYPDVFILYYDQLTELSYIKKNVEILYNLYDPDMIILLYGSNSLNASNNLSAINSETNNQMQPLNSDKLRLSSHINVHFLSTTDENWGDKASDLLISMYRKPEVL